METENNGLLSEAEEKYFDSKGETPIEAETPPAQDTVEAPAPADVKPPEGDTVAGDTLEAAEEPKTVPLAALREEREKRKKAQEEIRKREADYARLYGRLETLERLAKEPEKAPAPDPLADLEALKAREREREQAQRQDQENAAVKSQYFAAAKEFAAETPDFKEAYNYAVESRVKELTLLGWPEDQAAVRAQYDELDFVKAVIQSGRNPAQQIYALAQARGYSRKEPAKQAPSPTEKLESVTKGQQAARSLSNAAGAPSKPDALEALLNMSDEEFDAATEGKNWRKLMGG